MTHHTPGFLAIAGRAHEGGGPQLDRTLRQLGLRGVARIVSSPDLELATWGLDPAQPTPTEPLMLSRTSWGPQGRVSATQVGRWMKDGATEQLSAMLPPFGALGRTVRGTELIADPMGFRQLFLLEGRGWTAVSTSARVLGALNGFALDTDALRLQSLLGWQLGQRTIFSGVTKLSPGESVSFVDGRAVTEVGQPPGYPRDVLDLDLAVAEAADILRSVLDRYLEQCPDPTLQLTGGQDSRIILSAIPPARRRGLKVMTLSVPGSPDARIAAMLSARYGMRHTVRSLDDLERLTPEEAFSRVCDAARRIDCMADPLARAATVWAEGHFDQGNRLSGLGGEIARGFYYTGRVRTLPVTRARAERLARWRMFANEAVETRALTSPFAAQALPRAVDTLHEILAASGRDWYTATDDLYYRQRMQRWAGLGESAVCFDRVIVNPMLDSRFLAIADALHPRDKQNSRFLARLQVALDPELAHVPLDNRPPPIAYARPGPYGAIRQGVAKASLSASKVRQRVTRAHRPPAGGTVLAGKVQEYLRMEPGTLDPLRHSGVFDDDWLDGLGSGSVRADPSSLAFLVNLLVASTRAGSSHPD